MFTSAGAILPETESRCSEHDSAAASVFFPPIADVEVGRAALARLNGRASFSVRDGGLR